jgi:3-hydroxybutyryl-CoA dehydrogenase
MVTLPKRVSVVGAGTMGAGIAVVFARGGADVRVAARRPESIERARRRADEILGGFGDAAAAAHVSFTVDVPEALAGAELVVETIVEAVEPKRAVLALAEEHAAPGAILTSNTSSLSLGELASELSRPGRFAGLHWLNPPELVELVEVVGADATEPGVLETLRGWMEALGKAPVVVRRDVPGFVANRLQYALLREAFALVESGVCGYEDVDRALTRGLGARWAAVGPYETMDLGGLDIFRAVAGNLLPELSISTEPPAFLRDAVERGVLGAKSGEGLRGRYDEQALEKLAARRERILRALPTLRDEGGR